MMRGVAATTVKKGPPALDPPDCVVTLNWIWPPTLATEAREGVTQVTLVGDTHELDAQVSAPTRTSLRSVAEDPRLRPEICTRVPPAIDPWVGARAETNGAMEDVEFGRGAGAGDGAAADPRLTFTAGLKVALSVVTLMSRTVALMLWVGEARAGTGHTREVAEATLAVTCAPGSREHQ